jgi:hypothetical protein
LICFASACHEFPEKTEANIMKPDQLLVVAFAALVLAACQSFGSGPSPNAAAILVQQGFQPGSPAALNRNLEPDDIRTTALYTCAAAACGSLTVLIFGQDPKPAEMLDELRQTRSLTPAKARRIAGKFIEEGSDGTIKVSAVSTFSAPDGGLGIMIDATTTRSRKPVFHMRLSGIYNLVSGRMVAAVSPDRALAQRYGGRQMLE